METDAREAFRLALCLMYADLSIDNDTARGGSHSRVHIYVIMVDLHLHAHRFAGDHIMLCMVVEPNPG